MKTSNKKPKRNLKYIEIEYTETSSGSFFKNKDRSKKQSKSHKSKEKIDDRFTCHIMTSYEYAALLKRRASKIQAGDPPRIDWKEIIGSFNPIEIAKEEIAQRVA